MYLLGFRKQWIHTIYISPLFYTLFFWRGIDAPLSLSCLQLVCVLVVPALLMFMMEGGAVLVFVGRAVAWGVQSGEDGDRAP